MRLPNSWKWYADRVKALDDQRESVGVYRLSLVPGWLNPEDREHIIVEPTMARCFASVRKAVPCVCEECVQAGAPAQPAQERWLAFIRTGPRFEGYAPLIRLMSERRPTGHQYRGLATPSEIEAEVGNRARVDERRLALENWSKRPDVRDAGLVRQAIELSLDEIIDRLTPEEWRVLREKLTS